MSNKENVLITGSNSGIGRLTATTVASAGHRVYASMCNSKGKNQAAAHELSNLAHSEGLDLDILELDVSELSSIERVVEKLTARSQKSMCS